MMPKNRMQAKSLYWYIPATDFSGLVLYKEYESSQKHTIFKSISSLKIRRYVLYNMIVNDIENI